MGRALFRRSLQNLIAFGILVLSTFIALGSLAPSGQAGEAAGRPLVIAHRGGSKWAPENTMAAFRKSLEAGADGIELDIHRCKSGELIVIHDETLDRTTDGKGFIKDMTYDEMKNLSAGKWYGSEFAGERLPLLTDVLALVDGKMIVNIEIKNAPVAYPGIENDLAEVLKGYKHQDKILISSFDHELIRRVHEKMPDIKVAFLDYSIVADVAEYASKIGARAWNPGFGEMRADVVEKAHQSGLAVNVWTVDGKKNWDQAMEMRVDGIVTDDPAGLIAYLKERNVKPATD